MNAATAGNVDHYRSEFQASEAQLPGSNVAWVQRQRRAAIDCFAELGFPSPRNEDWKYTRVTPIEKRAFKRSPETCIGLAPDDLDDFYVPNLSVHRLVFLNGRYSRPLSKPEQPSDGTVIKSLAAMLTEDTQVLEPHLARYADAGAHGFSALNTAFMGDGAYVYLPKGTRLEKPIHLLFVSTTLEEDIVTNPRILVVADEGSEATVIESYVSLGQSVYFTNALTEIVLAGNSRLQHYKLQQESAKAFHVATLQAHQRRDSRFTSHSISLGGSLVRNDINVVLDAEGAECALNGLYAATGRQHMDYHTRIDHAKPYGASREFYKGVLGGHSRGVFNGRVYVHPHAQKTDAQQSNDNLLLSPDAEVDTKPQLEIYADDVKCAHGATVGQLDEDMVFYLRSRGIESQAARGLLTYGFAKDVIDKMENAGIRTKVNKLLVAKLPNADELRGLIQ